MIVVRVIEKSPRHQTKRISKRVRISLGRNTQVHSVLERYRERQERLELMNRVYEPVWGKMYLKTVKRENRKI